jgi:2-methylcitrate dehydratase PrpD
MTDSFIQRMTALIATPTELSASAMERVRRAFEDTLAVIYAGWHESVTRICAGTVPGAEHLRPGNAITGGLEHTAFLHGVAAHALDYDDVHMASTTHPSVPIVAALLAARHLRPEAAGRLAPAYAVGLAVNLALGRVLGFPHYEKGWHATTTIGPLAAAAAVSHYLEADDVRAAHALALAASQAGGMQRNFGTMAKPVQAGFSAAAGYRAAVLAQAGITADPDPFSAKGFFDLYGGAHFPASQDAVTLDLAVEGICVKLYPCCYMAHRPAAAALHVRQTLLGRGIGMDSLGAVEIHGEKGVFTALRVGMPNTGSEGKFSGPYVAACALTDGEVTLAHFTDAAVRREDLRALAARISLVEHPETPASAEGGAIELVARDRAGLVVAQARQQAFPGSPESPPTQAQLAHKVRDCLAHYHAGGGDAIRYERFEEDVDALLAAGNIARHAEAPGRRQRAAGD